MFGATFSIPVLWEVIEKKLLSRFKAFHDETYESRGQCYVP
jgi:hypothetical protein